MSNQSRRAMLKAGGAFAAFAPFVSACAPASVLEATGSVTPSKPGFVDGVRMAELIASGEMTSAEAVEAAIARTEAVNPQINAIANETFASARADAETELGGAFAGVPSFTKDLLNRKDEPTLWGSRAFEGYVPIEDSPFAAAWREAGIISLGKTTTPEMGLISSTEPLVTGATRNPWDTSRIPGGSSGGAAALVAARATPFAHASDGGGSIRIPASCCGLFGLKPSAGRLRSRSEGKPAVDISVNHAVTLTVRDSAALFSVAETNDGSYPRLGAITEPVSRRLKIAYAPEPAASNTTLDPEVRSAMDDVAQLCIDLGHEVIDYSLPTDGDKFVDQFLMYWAAGAAQFAQDAAAFSGKPISPEILEPWTLGLAQMFAARQEEMPDIIAYLQAFGAEYDAWFNDFDLLLTPTLARPPVPIGEQDPAGDFDTVMESVLGFAAYTAPMNVAGAASVSVPLSWTESGLPVGAMFSGRKGDDGLLLELGYELESARPWIDRLPPVVAT